MRHKSVPIRRGVGSGYGDILIHMQSPDMNDVYNPQHLCINTFFVFQQRLLQERVLF